MTLQEAEEKLAALRKRQRRLRKQIDDLREFIFSKGRNPDRPEDDLAKRNRAIYKLYKKGFTYTAVADKYKLSATRIRGICLRIDYLIQNEKSDYQYYQKK